MPLHLNEFQKDQFQGYIENIPKSREYLLSEILPDQDTKDINFSYGVINGEYAKAASITGFNASAPLRDPKQLSVAFGSVSKVQHGQRLDEEQLLHFNRPRDEQEKEQVVQYVYDLSDDLVTGVRDIEEYLRAQAIYNGVINYSDPINDVHVDVNFNIPSENKLKAEKDWSDSKSNPLKDIQNAITQYKKANKNRKPAYMHITSETEANLLTNEQIRVQIFGTETGQRLITKDDLANGFSALSFPEYRVNDDIVELEGKGEVQLLDNNKVVFIGEEVGNTYFGPTVENNYNSGIYVEPFVQETNPPMQAVYVGETVFPAIKRPQAIVHLDVGESTP